MLDGTSGSTVSGLTVTGNGRGIDLAGSNGNLLVGNVASESTQDGIRLGASSSNTISGNTVSKDVFGVGIADGSNDNIVSGNTVSKSLYFGVAVFCGSDGNTVSGNSVVNTTTTTGPLDGHGIIVRSGSDATQVLGNGANLNAADGIHVDLGGGCQNPSDNVLPTGTVISGNTANLNLDLGSSRRTRATAAGTSPRTNGNALQTSWAC